MSNRITLASVRVGLPRVIGQHKGQVKWSSIDRQQVAVPQIYCTYTGLAGDQATDTRAKSDGGQMHGGHDKAVYVYPQEHYYLWAQQLSAQVTLGRSFGENFRIKGANESTVRIGDVWQIGEVVFEVTKPRTPCATLEVYYRQPMIKLMRANSRCGWYLRVRQPGVLPTSGEITVVGRGEGPTIDQAFAAKMNR